MKPDLFIVLGATCIAFAPILVSVTGLPPTASAFYRCGLAALILLPLGLRSIPKVKEWGFLVLAGLVFCVDLFLWHKSIVYVGAGLATILANTQVFFATLIGWVYFSERVSRRTLAATLVAFLGVCALCYTSDVVGEDYWPGIWFGTSTGLTYSVYIACMRRAVEANHTIPVVTTIFWISVFAGLALGTIMIFETGWQTPSYSQWPAVIGLAVIPQIVGWQIISANLPKVPVARAAMILLVQPILATILGAVLLGESMQFQQVLGAAVTLAAVYYVTVSRA